MQMAKMLENRIEIFFLMGLYGKCTSFQYVKEKDVLLLKEKHNKMCFENKGFFVLIIYPKVKQRGRTKIFIGGIAFYQSRSTNTPNWGPFISRRSMYNVPG